MVSLIVENYLYELNNRKDDMGLLSLWFSSSFYLIIVNNIDICKNKKLQKIIYMHNKLNIISWYNITKQYLICYKKIV